MPSGWTLTRVSGSQTQTSPVRGIKGGAGALGSSDMRFGLLSRDLHGQLWEAVVVSQGKI